MIWKCGQTTGEGYSGFQLTEVTRDAARDCNCFRPQQASKDVAPSLKRTKGYGSSMVEYWQILKQKNRKQERERDGKSWIPNPSIMKLEIGAN